MSRRTVILSALVVILGAFFSGWLVWNRYSVKRQAACLKRVLAEHPLNHLGIIMDGNRRWARRNGYKSWIGHQYGVEPLKAAVKFCLEMGIKHLTVYALSLENLQRPADELSFLFDILAQEIAGKELQSLKEHGVKIRFIGDRRYFPEKLIPLIEDIQEKTKDNDTLFLNLLFCYGGKQEIVQAARKLCSEKVILPEDDQAAEKIFDKALWSYDIPPVDLLIRTGGEHRISNFLLFKIAYSEICFLTCYWPDLVERDLVDAVLCFTKSQRRFGK